LPNRWLLPERWCRRYGRWRRRECRWWNGFAEWPKQWLREGREQGLAEGREQGLAEGREQGVAEGREQGLTQGVDQQRALLCRQAAARFDADTAARLADLLASIADPERLAEVGDWLVRCDTAAEFFARFDPASRA
jgi:hypothetical protein